MGGCVVMWGAVGVGWGEVGEVGRCVWKGRELGWGVMVMKWDWNRVSTLRSRASGAQCYGFKAHAVLHRQLAQAYVVKAHLGSEA